MIKSVMLSLRQYPFFKYDIWPSKNTINETNTRTFSFGNGAHWALEPWFKWVLFLKLTKFAVCRIIYVFVFASSATPKCEKNPKALWKSLQLSLTILVRYLYLIRIEIVYGIWLVHHRLQVNTLIYLELVLLINVLDLNLTSIDRA